MIEPEIKDKNNTEFEIVGVTESEGVGASNGLLLDDNRRHAYVNGERKFKRIFIRRKPDGQTT